jgi:hypothetical protein
MRSIVYTVFLLLVLGAGCKKSELVPASNSDRKGSQKMDGSALSHTKQYNADVATAWFHLLTTITRVTPYAPPPTARIFAYSGMALYESVVPGMPSYQSMYTYLTGNAITVDKKKDYYWPAAANAALARIASRLLANYTATPNLTGIQELENNFNSQFQSQVGTDKLEFSKEFGKYVADIIYDWSKTDGTLTPVGALAGCPPYIPLGGPGNWVPTPPGLFPAAGACQGTLRTFVPGIVNVSMPPPAPSFSTVPGSVFYNAAVQVYQNVLNVSPRDLVISQAWRDLLGTNYNTPSHMFKLSAQIIDKENLDLEKAAEIFAKEGIANFDAIASAIHAKFHYALLRPVTYVRNVLGFSSWNSVYPTPQHPAYPAVAPAAAGSAVVILEKAFGTNYAFSDTTQKALYGTWNYASFNELLTDVGRSRSHNGLNFQFAVDEGIIQGRMVGEIVNQLPFKKP